GCATREEPRVPRVPRGPYHATRDTREDRAMVKVVKLGVKRPVTGPLLPDPTPRAIRYTIISADDHLMEPPHAFEGRLPAKYQDEAPRVVETEEGHEVWVFEDTPYFQAGFQAVAGRAW